MGVSAPTHPRRADRRAFHSSSNGFGTRTTCVGFNRQNLHMPPASNGASSTFGGEDCGRSGVAQGDDGVEKARAWLSWIRSQSS
jgi:hypothetical protein